jgi:hypothetical protein
MDKLPRGWRISILENGDIVFATTRSTLKNIVIIPKSYDNQLIL